MKVKKYSTSGNMFLFSRRETQLLLPLVHSKVERVKKAVDVSGLSFVWTLSAMPGML